jgi:two-component system response regulator DctR
MNAPLPAVHVVDDEEAVRDAVAFLLEMHGMQVRRYANGPALLAALAAGPLRGCLLLDVRMEPMSGLQLQDELHARGVTLPVLFLSGHGDIPMAVQAVHKGALDFLVKPFDAAALLSCVEQALHLEAGQHAAAAAADRLRERFASLTEREREVMERVVAGKLNKVIADELDIAMRTVEVHRSRVLSKLGVRSAAELATLLSRLRRAAPEG